MNGVECQLAVKSTSEKRSSARTNHDRIRKRTPTQPRSDSSDSEEEDAASGLPTAADLAQSFLETEPRSEEKAELEAALQSEGQEYGTESVLSDDGDEALGTGAALSLPAFMTGFLQGIVDRLQVHISGVVFNLDVELPNESPRSSGSTTPDIVTVQLRIEKIGIEGVTHQVENASEDKEALISKDGKRLVNLSEIYGTLISEASFFSGLARSTALPSPVMQHSEVFPARHASSKSPSVHSNLYESQILSRPSIPRSVMEDSQELPHMAKSSSSDEGSIRESFTTSEHGRFDDAVEDEIQSRMSQSASIHNAETELGSSSIFHNSAYLDQISGSQYLDHEEDAEESLPPPGLYSQDSLPARQLSRPSTPRASTHSPVVRAIEQESQEDTLSDIGHSSMLRSSFLSGRKRFSEARLSRSQVSAELASGSIAPEPVKEEVEHNYTACTNGPDHNEDDEPTPVGEDSLAQSQYFSHEEAESMYLSAVSHGGPAVPGGWESNSENELPSNPSSPARPTGTPTRDILYSALDPSTAHLHTLIPSEQSTAPVKSDTTASRILSSPSSPGLANSRTLPKVSSNASEHSNASSEAATKLSKQIFYLDSINVYLPTASGRSEQVVGDSAASKHVYESAYGALSEAAQSASVIVPGAFSTHFSTPRSTNRSNITTSEHRRPLSPANEGESTKCPTEVILGHLQTQFDISIGRVLYKLVQQLLSSLDTKPKQEASSSDQGKSKDTTTSPLDVNVFAKEISVKFLERLDGRLGSSRTSSERVSWKVAPDSDILLRTVLKGLRIRSNVADSLTKTHMTLNKFLFGYSHDNIVSFDAALQMRSSIRDLKTEGIDITAEITQTPVATRFEVNTLPIHCSIDLQRLDETFSWFGGLSSVLNMGSSIASVATVTAVTPVKTKPRGVRFDTPIQPDDKSLTTQNKADVRIGGFVLDLVGSECSVGLETSAVKLVQRDTGLGVAIQKIRLSGPHLSQSNDDPAINVELTGTRLEYLSAPRDSDLDRLLDIITPSKTKYDQADDILIDTLVRQRKQGPVLNINVESVQGRLEKLNELSYLPDLGEEIAKLATVAKYLPEADRPGMLVLLKLQQFNGSVDVNNTLGNIRLAATDVNIAQITLPILVALSMGTLQVLRNGTEELIGSAGDAALREAQSRAPALMARMVGDALEPTVKIKLWNVKIEYRVPTLMILLGLAGSASQQDLSQSLSASIATLTETGQIKAQQLLVPERQHSNDNDLTAKPINLDVSLRDCVIGLNPLGLPSKMLVVLTHAMFNATLPKDQNVTASFDVNKASLLIVDNVALLSPGDIGARARRHSYDASTQVADFCSTGYVSVSYISSANVKLQMTKRADGESCLDVDVRDDLFVLESCADSTQTLISIMGALAPPATPSKATKYRTKVIPVHDLLASLSGDAFGTAEGQYNFDDDFGLGEGLSDIGDVAGNVEGELDFDSQYYQQDEVDPYEEAISEDLGASLHSAQLSSTDTHDGVLLESLLESNDEVEDNQPLDFVDDHFATGSVIEGTAHRWNSSKNTYDMSEAVKVHKSPLKVCVRDVHIIWNLFDGYDWQHTRDVITKAVQDVESKAIERRARSDRRSTFDMDVEDDESVIGDFLFNSIYIGIPTSKDPRELAAAINHDLDDAATETESIATTSVSSSPSRQGGSHRGKTKRLRLNRSKHHKITFELRGVSVDMVTFPPGTGETQSTIDVRVHDLEVYDHVPTSTWKLFATYMQEAGERETGSSMVHLEILNVKPIPDLAASEIVLKMTVLPLRLHVDQDALDFITRFFEFKDDSAPISSASPGDPPFIQRAEVNSIVVKLDFKPKRVDYAGLRSGHTTEMMNFLILEEADMVLRHTIIYGVSGLEKLGQCLNDIWMPDVKRNQLPGILAGLAPVRQLVNVGGGIQKLVVVPMREYKKDGRIVRSISKGAAAFAKTTGTELVKLGAKVAIGVQTVLQGAEGFLGPTTESTMYADNEDEAEKNKISLYANQPVGVLQGLKGGYAGLQRDLIIARDAIIAVPGEVMEGGSAAGVLKAVRKHAPTVILRPAIGVAKAGGQIFLGATNSLDPSNLKRADAVSVNLSGSGER